MCPLSFSQKLNLNQQKRNVHIKVKQSKCELCGNKFKTNSDVKKHMIYYNKETEECDDCGKLVTNIIKHKEVHGKQRI